MLHKLFAVLHSPLRKRTNRSTTEPYSRLRVEPLETRLVPACTTSLAAGVLTINCNAANDLVNISDNGTGAVTVNGGLPFTGVSGVKVAAGSGNDTVNYALTGNLTTARTVSISLGNGQDKATLDFDDDNPATRLVADAALSITVKGENGTDTVTAAFDLAINSKVKIAVDGGNANDQVTAILEIILAEPDLVGPDTSDLDLSLVGGNGMDKVTANLTLAADSAGDLKAAVSGNNGPDTLTLTVKGATTGIVLASLDGGLGPDKCTHTANVTAKNCEMDTLVV